MKKVFVVVLCVLLLFRSGRKRLSQTVFRFTSWMSGRAIALYSCVTEKSW